jgi:hypothetical protein
MGPLRRTATAATVLATVAVVALIAIPAAIAAFGARAQNEGNTVTAAPDFTPPAITATLVAKSLGGATGYVHKGGTYFAYANVSADTGNPASGLATVKANLGEITSGQTEAVLTAGSYTVGTVTYGYRSTELTANASVEGSKNYSVTATDKAGNARTVAGTATVDNVVPTATDIQTANGGTTVGKAEESDTVTYTFSEPMGPQSILSGWRGAATTVTARIYDNGLLGLGGNDQLQIYDSTNATLLPLGSVDLGRVDYAGGVLGGSYRFVNSSMTMSGNTITIVFGAYSSTILIDAGRATAGGTGTMVWTPAATPYDRAGNAMSASPATESGGADKEF